MDPRKQKTMEALLQAAERMIAEQRSADVTVDEIAEDAGVAVGSIYNHFGSKSGLFAAAIDRALGTDAEYMDRAYTPDRSPLEQVIAAGEEYVRFYFDHPTFFRMLAFPPDPGQYAAGQEVAERMGQRVAEQNSRLTAAIQRAIDEGIVRPMDAEKVTTMLWAALNGIMSLAWRPDSMRKTESELRELIATVYDIYALGLLPRD